MYCLVVVSTVVVIVIVHVKLDKLFVMLYESSVTD